MNSIFGGIIGTSSTAQQQAQQLAQVLSKQMAQKPAEVRTHVYYSKMLYCEITISEIGKAKCMWGEWNRRHSDWLFHGGYNSGYKGPHFKENQMWREIESEYYKAFLDTHVKNEEFKLSLNNIIDSDK